MAIKNWRGAVSHTEMANDVLAFVEKMSFNRVCLIGCSMGDKAVKNFSLLHSDCISKLIACLE